MIVGQAEQICLDFTMPYINCSYSHSESLESFSAYCSVNRKKNTRYNIFFSMLYARFDKLSSSSSSSRVYNWWLCDLLVRLQQLPLTCARRRAAPYTASNQSIMKAGKNSSAHRALMEALVKNYCFRAVRSLFIFFILVVRRIENLCLSWNLCVYLFWS